MDSIADRIWFSQLEAVALQEVCRKQLVAIQDRLDEYQDGKYKIHFGYSRTIGTTQCDTYGTGVITLHYSEPNRYDLPSPSSGEQRINSCITTMMWGQPVRACSTHLSYNGEPFGYEYRQDQIAHVRTYCAGQGGYRAILQMGDFNAPSPSSEMSPLTSLLGEVDDTANAHNTYAWTYTHTDTGPYTKFDYISYGRYYLGNTVNYNIVATKYGPGLPDEATENDFDHQSLLSTRMYVR